MHLFHLHYFKYCSKHISIHFANYMFIRPNKKTVIRTISYDNIVWGYNELVYKWLYYSKQSYVQLYIYPILLRLGGLIYRKIKCSLQICGSDAFLGITQNLYAKFVSSSSHSLWDLYVYIVKQFIQLKCWCWAGIDRRKL